MIKLTIDTREPLSKIKPIVDRLLDGPRFKNFDVIYKKLDFGDYFLEDNDINMLIQRKEISDFVGSYGGLPDQFLHLKLLSDYQALILENNYTIKEGSGSIWLDRGSGLEEVMRLQTAVRMNSRIQKNGSWIYHTNNLFETLLTIFYIGEYLRELEKPSMSGKLDIQQTLITIPGIGKITIEKLKERYINPIEALKNINDWATSTTKKSLEIWK